MISYLPGAGSGWDKFAENLQRALIRRTDHGPYGKVMSVLSGERWLGHPLHPCLPREARRVAAVHWALNASAVTLYLASSVLRSRSAWSAGRGTALAALGLVGPGAYLGGHLVYRLGVGQTKPVA